MNEIKISFWEKEAEEEVEAELETSITNLTEVTTFDLPELFVPRMKARLPRSWMWRECWNLLKLKIFCNEIDNSFIFDVQFANYDLSLISLTLKTPKKKVFSKRTGTAEFCFFFCLWFFFKHPCPLKLACQTATTAPEKQSFNWIVAIPWQYLAEFFPKFS